MKTISWSTSMLRLGISCAVGAFALVMAAPAHAVCTPVQADAELLAHIERLRTDGWKAIHRSTRTMMLGCEGVKTAKDCLRGTDANGSSRFPSTAGNDWSAGWNSTRPKAVMRFLADVPPNSRYWSRNSPDGRFIGAGGYILDLDSVARGMPLRRISTAMPYDPAFFPDNSGINYAGGRFCPSALLRQLDRTSLDFNEPGCSSDGRIGLYQSVGTALNGTDYLAASGPFSSDAGRRRRITEFQPKEDAPSWSGSGYLNLFPMIFNGTSFQVTGAQRLTLPQDGDWQLAGSGTMAVSRIAGTGSTSGQQEGYHVYRLERAAGGTTYTATPKATFCAFGGKATFSADERYITFYHAVLSNEYADYGYTSADAAGWRALLQGGASNIFVHDLITARTIRVTTMNAGQFAMFPSFRADGWLYFVVKERNRNREYYVASSVLLDP